MDIPNGHGRLTPPAVPDLAGVIDLHVHAGPDVRPRKMSGLELALAARAAGMRGLVFKNHHSPTAVPAGLLREAVPGLEVFGGVALNEAVGGLNPEAADAALRMGAAAVWLPTLDAEHERAFRGRPGTGIRLLDGGGKLLGPVHEVVRLVGEADAILGLGHVSPDEMYAVVRAAHDAGLRKVLVNHPEINFLNLPLSAQGELAGPGVYFERCHVRASSAVGYDAMARAIRLTGVGANVVATDLGQADQTDPVAGLAETLAALAGHGFARPELEVMACHNPAALLGLPTEERGDGGETQRRTHPHLAGGRHPGDAVLHRNGTGPGTHQPAR